MEFVLTTLTATYFGILTSISPCPLATNVVALSYISKKITHPRLVLLNGLIYSFGRTLAYILLSLIIVKSFLDMPILSHFLQKYMNKILGPTLIIIGMFLLELIPLNINFEIINEKWKESIVNMGIFGAFALGLLFALSFCPTSAALFFGGLIPLAIQKNSTLIIPFFYGISTGIPVIIFAFLISFGTTHVSKVYNIISNVELWARKITGVIFILVGIYLTLIYIFQLHVLLRK